MTELRIKISQSKQNFLEAIEDKLKLYHDIQNILHKINNDGMLEILRQGIKKVLENEVDFATKRLTQMEKNNKQFDLKTQVKRNTQIFKENLKVIVGMIREIQDKNIVNIINQSKLTNQIKNFQKIEEEVSLEENISSVESNLNGSFDQQSIEKSQDDLNLLKKYSSVDYTQNKDGKQNLRIKEYQLNQEQLFSNSSIKVDTKNKTFYDQNRVKSQQNSKIQIPPMKQKYINKETIRGSKMKSKKNNKSFALQKKITNNEKFIFYNKFCVNDESINEKNIKTHSSYRKINHQLLTEQQISKTKKKQKTKNTRKKKSTKMMKSFNVQIIKDQLTQIQFIKKKFNYS